MKKTLAFLTAVIALCIVSACGGNNNAGSDKTGSDKNTGYATYKEALANNDFEAVHKIIDQAEADLAKCESASGERMFGDSEREKLEQEFANQYGFEASKEDIDNVKKEIFDKEIKYLAADGSSEACARLAFLFTDYEIKGTRLPSGLRDYDEGYHNPYSASVNDYNSKLNMVLDLAISQDNKELANKVIKLYKENMEIFKGGSGHKTKDGRYVEIAPDGTEVDGDHCYVTYNYKDKEAAKKKYEEAFGKSDMTDE